MHRGQVMGRCEPATGIKPFTALVDQVMNAEPYASARRVFWVVDDGASHRGDSGRTDERRLAERGHGAPAGARLLAQPEICFSIIQRKLLVPDDFADPPALAAKIGVFERRYYSAAAFQPGKRGPVIW